MLFLIKQELFKLYHKQGTIYSILTLSILSCSVALVSKTYPTHFIPQELFASNYAMHPIIALIIISHAANTISSEYEYNSFKVISTQSYSRVSILLSKICTTFIYTAVLYTVNISLTLLYKQSFFKNSFSFDVHTTDGKFTLLQYWMLTNFANMMTLIMLVSLVFLVATLINKGSIAMCVGVVGYVILNIISTMMFRIIKEVTILKWNPLNMLNLPQQISLPDSFGKMTLLTTPELVLGNIGYSIIFLMISLCLYSIKEV